MKINKTSRTNLIDYIAARVYADLSIDGVAIISDELNMDEACEALRQDAMNHVSACTKKKCRTCTGYKGLLRGIK